MADGMPEPMRDALPRMAVLIPGGQGQLGVELSRFLKRHGAPLVHAPGSAEFDISDPEAVADAVDSFTETARDNGLRPIVLNAAAYTAVDAAESDRERAAAVNSRGAAKLAAACFARESPLVHVSTDYVFPGTANDPYEPEDETGPRTVYGSTKLDGERSVAASGARAWVVRTGWVYGARGSNFVKTMARLESERAELSVVDDQIGGPTWSGDLAAGLVELACRIVQRRGPQRPVLHCTNSGAVSWFELARAVFAELGADPGRVHACGTEDFPRPAPRPAYSVLSGGAWHAAELASLRSWREALTAAFEVDGAALREQR